MAGIKTVYFFFDDSGVLHRNETSGYFVYAGYVFLEREQVDDANRKYRALNKNIAVELGADDELKASALQPKHKRALVNVMRGYNSVSSAVQIGRVFDRILRDKRSICRYKDYVLKRAIKHQVRAFIEAGVISPNDDMTIKINIDEQNTATDGRYSFRESVYEELRHGIVNFDYGVQHPNIVSGNLTVEVRYCNSKNNYLIQASDILANRIWTSFCVNNPVLRQIPNHTPLLFP